MRRSEIAGELVQCVVTDESSGCPSRTSAWASLRLMESRRLLPTITAMRGKCVVSTWLNPLVTSR